ncbi:MAG: SIMPL domain-containing protein [Casimicrobiaceae bacterium]
MKTAFALLLCATLPAFAQSASTAERVPSVNVSASASVTLPNDRMHAWLRTEAESVNAAAAAGEVNGRMGRVLNKLKALPAIDVASSGYSSDAIVDKGKPTRWRVSQSVTLGSADFAVLASAIGSLQDDGMLLSGLGFSLSATARKEAEDRVTQQAIHAWQQRAANAAQALGYGAWRVGTVNVQTSDGARPYMAMRSDMKTMAVAAAPVAADAGTTDVSVSVSGEALLSAPR